MKLIEGFVSFEKQTNTLLSQLLDRLYTRNRIKAENEVKKLVREKLLASPTAQSLIGNESESLMGHFGIPIGEEDERVENIIDVIADFVKVKVSRFPPSNNKVRAKISIGLGDEVYPTLQNLDDGQVLTEQGVVLYWLEWLLLGGFLPIIEDYHIIFQIGRGRSGQAFMEITNTWSVPQKHAGTLKNNWLTRELQEENFVNLVASTTFRVLNS